MLGVEWNGGKLSGSHSCGRGSSLGLQGCVCVSQLVVIWTWKKLAPDIVWPSAKAPRYNLRKWKGQCSLLLCTFVHKVNALPHPNRHWQAQTIVLCSFSWPLSVTLHLRGLLATARLPGNALAFWCHCAHGFIHTIWHKFVYYFLLITTILNIYFQWVSITNWTAHKYLWQKLPQDLWWFGLVVKSTTKSPHILFTVNMHKQVIEIVSAKVTFNMFSMMWPCSSEDNTLISVSHHYIFRPPSPPFPFKALKSVPNMV